MLTNEEVKANIAANVRRLLLRHNWSQADLAEKTGDSEMQISRVCRGMIMPPAAIVARIAEAFDVAQDRLTSPPPERSPATHTENSRQTA